MKPLMFAFRCLLEDDAAQDLVEYALVIGFVALASITAMKSLTTSIGVAFAAVGTALNGSG